MGMRYRRGRTARMEPNGSGFHLRNTKLRNFVKACWGVSCNLKVLNEGGLFRLVSKQFCLFRLFRYRFETPKQTEKFFFWFHETNRNKRETDLVSVCFGSNRNFFFSFRGHPTPPPPLLLLRLGLLSFSPSDSAP